MKAENAACRMRSRTARTGLAVRGIGLTLSFCERFRKHCNRYRLVRILVPNGTETSQDSNPSAGWLGSERQQGGSQMTPSNEFASVVRLRGVAKTYRVGT